VPALITFSNLPRSGFGSPPGGTAGGSTKNPRGVRASARALNQIYTRIRLINRESIAIGLFYNCVFYNCSQIRGCGSQISGLKSRRSDVIMCLLVASRFPFSSLFFIPCCFLFKADRRLFQRLFQLSPLKINTRASARSNRPRLKIAMPDSRAFCALRG